MQHKRYERTARSHTPLSYMWTTPDGDEAGGGEEGQSARGGTRRRGRGGKQKLGKGVAHKTRLDDDYSIRTVYTKYKFGMDEGEQTTLAGRPFPQTTRNRKERWERGIRAAGSHLGREEGKLCAPTWAFLSAPQNGRPTAHRKGGATNRLECPAAVAAVAAAAAAAAAATAAGPERCRSLSACLAQLRWCCNPVLRSSHKFGSRSSAYC